MINGLIGKKLKMTTSYDDDNGFAIPTTIIKLGPCKVTQVKTTNEMVTNLCKLDLMRKRV